MTSSMKNAEFKPQFRQSGEYAISRQSKKGAGSMNESLGRQIASVGGIALLAGASLNACATVKVEAPDKPIEINLNVKIDQEVRVKLDKDIEDLIENNPDIF